MNTQENNKMIAEFMGSKTIRINLPFEYDLGEELPTSGNTCNSITDAMEEVQTEVDEGIINGCDLYMEVAQYHTSWDWLMPVVQKCYKIDNEEGFDSLVDAVSTLDIDGTYNAVVEFINQYNKNQ